MSNHTRGPWSLVRNYRDKMAAERDELLEIVRAALPEIRHAATAEARRNRLMRPPRTDRQELLKRAEAALS